MNRKQRKERLKRLNAKRKKALKDPLNPEFVHRISWFTTEELHVVLDHLYATFAFDGSLKVKSRIDYVEAVIESRNNKRRWMRNPLNPLNIDPDSEKYRL